MEGLEGYIPVDASTFTAACPGCGQDCDWTQLRYLNKRTIDLDYRVEYVIPCCHERKAA